MSFNWLTTGLELFGLPWNFLLPPFLPFFLKSDLSGLSGLSKPLDIVILAGTNCFCFKVLDLTFFSTLAGMKSSTTLTTIDDSSISDAEDTAFFDLLNSEFCNSLKKSAADLKTGFDSSSSSSLAFSVISISASSATSICDSASSPNLVFWDLAVSFLPVLECLSNFLSLPFFLEVDDGPFESLFLLENFAPASLPEALGLPPLDFDGSAFGGTPSFLVDFCGATISFGAMKSSSSPETSLPNNA